MDELERLKAENRLLRDLLKAHGIPSPAVPRPDKTKPAYGVSASLSPEHKVRLFRRLFRGREDIYATRWQSGEGKSGYSPVCERDWKAWYAAPPEDRKRVDKQTRRYLPLTDEAIDSHLRGKLTIGIYPLLLDETCWFLAADFDKKTWEDDSAAFMRACADWDVTAALERSRSGKGGHVWIFFSTPVPAILARKLGCALLTRAMERRHQIGLDSYDRFFPNQDTMPIGGFGNLIALPLQRVPRDQGNSVFIDNNLAAYPDQWAFLSEITPMSSDDVEKIVDEAQRKGDLVGVRFSVTEDDDTPDPWTLPPSRRRPERRVEGPLPATVQVVRSNLLFIDKTDLPPAMINRLLRLAAFQNPEFYKAQSLRLSTYDKPRVISCGDDLLKYVAVPRGCLDDLISLLEDHSIRPVVRDERVSDEPVDVCFHGELRLHQTDAVKAVTAHDNGILCAPTAFGKTAAAAWIIAHRKVATMVLVHRQQLLDQWRERLAMFFDVPVDSIGQIGAGKVRRTGRIDVAVIQSLYHDRVVKDFVAEYGQVIADECHHLSAVTFEKVMREVKARYVLGLTATPVRKDGHHPIIYMQCGPIRYRMQARAMTESTPFRHVVVPRLTSMTARENEPMAPIYDLYQRMVSDRARNDLIARDLISSVRAGRSPLLLTGRKEHLDVFAGMLAGEIANVFILRGGTGRKQRKSLAEQIAAVRDGEPRVILATGSYIGEGFDDARLDTLFLAMPISWKGTLQQYVGRLHRLHESKRVVEVYDYVDINVRMLARMYERRLKGYGDIGYGILDTGAWQTKLLLAPEAG